MLRHIEQANSVARDRGDSIGVLRRKKNARENYTLLFHSKKKDSGGLQPMALSLVLVTVKCVGEVKHYRLKKNKQAE